ncbi:hypothetical protein ACTXT7_016861 [Hymenolepis weldensis]
MKSSQADRFECSDAGAEDIRENVNSSSKDVELIAEIPDEDGSELINDLIPANFVIPRGRKRRPYKIILL